MRTLLAACLLLTLAACGANPQAFGITGPGTQPVPTPSMPDESNTNANPGLTTVGPIYGPTNQPLTGSSGFWGYNE